MRYLLFFLPLFSYAQKGGLPFYPVLNKYAAIGYVQVDNSDSLKKYASIEGSKIYISANFELKSRIIVAKNVTIESDGKTITSKLFYSTFRVFESFTIQGANVTFKGINLVGDDPDIRTLDTMLYQCGIRCHTENFTMINCKLSKWGWACVYLHLMNGARIEQCYFSNTKNNGYGYGVWLEGKPGHSAIVKDCLFENIREAVDAGGQRNNITLIGNVTDSPFCSHKNDEGKIATSTTISGNYFYQTVCGWYYPPSDSGKLLIEGNYFTKDSAILIEPGYGVDVKENIKWIPSSLTILVDSFINSRLYFRLKESYPLYQIYYGDGTEGFTTAKKFNKSYSGTGVLKVRGFASSGIPTSWSYYSVNTNSYSVRIKSSQRFSSPGLYQLQIRVDDQIKYSVDATKVWNWTKVTLTNSGKKYSFRVVCLKPTSQSIQVWVDDFNCGMNNQNFELPTKGNWVQVLAATNTGSGLTATERFSGEQCWRFEWRNEINTPGYAEIYQGK